jgi:predicted membrane protein
METKNTSLDRRMVAGVLLILAGGLLLLDSADLLPFDLRHYLISWKTLLIGIGLITLSNRENRTTGWILIGIGLLFWMPEIMNYRIRMSAIFWPAVLIGIGLIVITRRSTPKGENFPKNKHVFAGSNRDHVNPEDFIDEMAIFGGGNTKIISPNFKGGKITAIFGGSDINMMSSAPSKEGCVIDTFMLFGGTNLIIPDDWQIKSEVVSIFGGYSDKRMLPVVSNPEKQLLIKGMVLFGGVEIKSY